MSFVVVVVSPVYFRDSTDRNTELARAVQWCLFSPRFYRAMETPVKVWEKFKIL